MIGHPANSPLREGGGWLAGGNVQIELMSYTHAAEDKVIERYLLEKGVPVSLDKEVVIGKVASGSPHFLKDILFDFFIADVPVETLRAFPRHRASSYEGYREMSRDAAVRVVASLDGLELLGFFEGNLCSQKGTEPTALVYAMLAAAELACPSLFGGLAVPCPAGRCDIEKNDCRRIAREWAKRIQKLTRISCEAFLASRPNYVMTFDFTESLGYPVVLTVRKS